MAMPNRSMVVSEPLLPHCPAYESGYHYVSAPIESLSETILYYLAQEDERLRIVENAYQLVTSKLTFYNSIKTIMEAVNQLRGTTRPPANGTISR
jgi:spore maturation protein CgeB